MQKKFLTTDEITHGFGIDAATVQALVDSGDLKALADRGTWKYRRDDVEALIKSGKLHPTKELPVVDDAGLEETFGFATEATSSNADYIELDEDALSEQPTILRGDSVLDQDVLGDPDSSSDVHIVYEPTGGSFSDSDIRLGGSELLAASAPSGLTGEGSDSDVRTAPSSGEMRIPEASKTEEILIEDFDESNQLDEPDRRVDDRGVGSLETLTDLPTDWSDNPADAVFAAPDDADSGISLEGDSGITLDADSGITLDAGDSGISLDLGDSGISLDIGDSGISLDAGDSGINLAGSAPTLSEAADPLAATENQLDFRLADDEQDSERTVLDKMDQTAVISTMDSSDTFAPTLSGAIAAGESVEDLEVSPELDEVLADDDEFAEAELEEEIHEADDEAFSEEFAETGDEDEELAAAPGKARSREPGWGAPTFVLALSAFLLVGMNVWLAWSGLQTMWDGSDPTGPAASLVTTIGGLM